MQARTTSEMDGFWHKVDKTWRHHGRQAMRAVRGVLWDLHPHVAVRPVFVVGCSRAGTTLVYKTFSESTELGSLQRETHDFWSALHPLQAKNWATHALTAEEASSRDRDIISRYFYTHTGQRRFVDKNNQNGLCVPYLFALFPDAHFVYVKRSPGDNINSLIEGWGKSEEFATWSTGLPAQVAVDEGRYTQWCFFISDGWRNYVDRSIEEVCAFQYQAMNEAILSARTKIPAAQWTDICYEEMLQDPIQGFRVAFTSAGLHFGAHMEQHCAQVLSNPYNAFSPIAADKWRRGRNATRITRVLPVVADTARKMGYNV